MADNDLERGLAQLMGAHLLALSKATAVYQSELAKVFLGLQEEEGSEAAGPAYKMMRDLEKMGFASALFDQSPEGAERRRQSWTGGNAVLMENWLEFLGQPWRAYWSGLSRGSPTTDDEDS